MSSLQRRSALDFLGTANPFDNDAVALSHEPELGFARVTTREVSSKLDGQLLKVIDAPLRPLANRVAHGRVSVAGLSRRERLFFGSERDLRAIMPELLDALQGRALLADVSHQFESIIVSGPQSRALLSSLTPVSFDDDVFDIDQCLRTSFGETAVFVQRLDGDSNFRLMIDQSMAAYAWRLLKDAARFVLV